MMEIPVEFTIVTLGSLDPGMHFGLEVKWLKVKYALNHTDIYWDLNFSNNINFQSLEVVCRGSETQLQVTENVN